MITFKNPSFLLSLKQILLLVHQNLSLQLLPFLLTRSLSLSCFIVDLRYVFMSFNSEKPLSQLAILTHILRDIRRTIKRFESDSINPHLIIHCKRSRVVRFSPPIACLFSWAFLHFALIYGIPSATQNHPVHHK